MFLHVFNYYYLYAELWFQAGNEVLKNIKYTLHECYLNIIQKKNDNTNE